MSGNVSIPPLEIQSVGVKSALYLSVKIKTNIEKCGCSQVSCFYSN